MDLRPLLLVFHRKVTTGWAFFLSMCRTFASVYVLWRYMMCACLVVSVLVSFPCQEEREGDCRHHHIIDWTLSYGFRYEQLERVV